MISETLQNDINIVFQFIKQIKEFLKENLHFLQSSKPFQSQGHFGEFLGDFGIWRKMPSRFNAIK